MTDFIIPDSIEPAIGFRTWKVDPTYRPGVIGLRAVTFGRVLWTPRKAMVAQCEYHASGTIARKARLSRSGQIVRAQTVRQALNEYNERKHVSPDERCSCGLYHKRTLKGIIDTHYWQPLYADKTPFIFGECALWGKVIIHDDGFKAQYAYPRHFFIPKLWWKLARPLADAWGVPVTLINPFDYLTKKGR